MLQFVTFAAIFQFRPQGVENHDSRVNTKDKLNLSMYICRHSLVVENTVDD